MLHGHSYLKPSRSIHHGAGAKDDDCFSGQQVVRWLLQNGVAASEQEALQLGNAMIKAGHFSPQSGTGGLENKKVRDPREPT